MTVTVRFEPEPSKTMLSVETSVGLEEEAVIRRLSALVSKSPMVNGIGPVEEFWTMV